MPGILPMKVIKVGTSAQSRIAQACDRCRSKKIRCDGITPCCTQCSNVGFECKTSDKLSRRAFPRGYTESLEERVRVLESEVKELKDLLDEKDEKIDILSRIHTNPRRTSSTSPSPTVAESKVEPTAQSPHVDTFRVQQSPCLLHAEDTDSYFMGASSGRSFVDKFKAKVQESGKPCQDFKAESFFRVEKKSSAALRGRRSTSYKALPRLVSDQLINIFFQEWAPLFPVLHRPTFLNIYTTYMANSEAVEDQHAIAQLNLVFGIAALSVEGNKPSTTCFESQWQAALDTILFQQNISTLQCLVLAQMYCIANADYNKLLHYKGIAISLSHRLGLHQSQKRFSLGILTVETRRKVFWTLYTLDCFSAASLGLPKLINDCDVHAEYPADVDDENVSEYGFQSTLPGEFTRISSALALFNASQIMSKVLEENYPAASSHDLSLQRIHSLNDELDDWQNSLPSHLSLQFVQDKPSTNVVGSRSPFLSLAYHYIRTLIHRPAVGSSLATRATPSVVALASSSKHIVQLVQLLEERRMSFTFCLNKNELLLLAGFGLLYQGLELDRKGKLIQDSQRLMCSVIEILDRNGAPGASDFKKIACAMISVDRSSNDIEALDSKITTRRMSDGSMPAPKTTSRCPRKQLQAFASRFASTTATLPLKRDTTWGRRFTEPEVAARHNATMYSRSDSQNSVSSVVSEPARQNSQGKTAVARSSINCTTLETPNLDYLSFTNEQDSARSYRFTTPTTMSKCADADRMIGFSPTQQVEAPINSLFPSPDVLSAYMSPSPSPATHDWASDVWMMPPQPGNGPASAHSVPSFSEEELTSGEELSNCDPIGDFPGITMPNMENSDGFDGLDVTLTL